MAAAQTQVPLWYLETGNWRKNEEMYARVRDYQENFKGKYDNHQYYHYHVRNKTVDEVCSIIRRWHMQHVGRGNPCVIAYDYVKLTGEKVDRNWAEHQAIGEKIDKLKRISEELSAPIITAMQLNRTGERGRANSVVDDASAISLSDRLQWFASFVAIFRRKSPEEISQEGREFGTHKLIPLATRFQGREAQGHTDLVRVAEGNRYKYVPNFINYNIENFSVSEHGTLQTITENRAMQATLDDQETERDNLL